MRICIDCRSLVRPEQTGVGRGVRLLLDEIRNNPGDHEWVLLTTGIRTPATDFSQWTGPQVTHLHRSVPNKVLHILKLTVGSPSLSQLVPGRVDHVVVPNLHFVGLDPVSTTVIIHDLSFAISPRWYSWKGRLWHRLIRPRRTAQHAAHIIVPSLQTKYDVMSFFSIDETKISVVPWFIGGETQKSSQPAAAPFLLYIGTIEPRKNVSGLLAAYEKSGLADEGVELHLAGSRGWGSRHLHRQMTKLRGVVYHGYVSPEKKEELLSQAHAVVYPSFYEGYGLPPLEALQYNKPLVISHHPALPEVIGSRACYVDPYNIADIAAALREVASNNESSTHQDGEQGAPPVEQVFSIRSSILKSLPSVVSRQ